MRSFTLIVVTSLLLSRHQISASSDDPSSTSAETRKRKNKLRRKLLDGIFGPPISSDQTVACIGETTTTFQTTTSSYIAAYPIATVGIPYKCAMTCDNTGVTSLTLAVTDATSVDDITTTESTSFSTSDGCSPTSTGIEVGHTATKSGNLYAIAFCEGGCSGASITCSDNCGARYVETATHWFYNAAHNIVQRFRPSNGVRRRLEHDKYIRAPQ